MEMTSNRIIIADDHAVVRTGLQLILDETEDMEIVEEARDGDELLEKLKESVYDMVILDMAMPGKDALDVLKEIKKNAPELPVVIFSMNPDEPNAVRMIQNGASAYINKQTKSKQLIDILRIVASGKKYIFPHQAEMLVEAVSAIGKQKGVPHHLLTDRESQVFILLASGVRISEIEEKLSISKSTISNHRNNIMKKMSMSLNSELTRYAIKHGIIH